MTKGNTGNYNTGNYNTGYYNTGYYNTGDSNTGNYNTGNCNTGHYNTGYYNTGDYNTGSFNTVSPEGGLFFNRWLSFSEWDAAKKPKYFAKVKLTEWVSESCMSSKEREDRPEYITNVGYLKEVPYKEAWKKAYESATKEDRELTTKLPNFDYDVFEEITGLDLRKKDTCEGKEVEIDGVVYVLKAKQ